MGILKVGDKVGFVATSAKLEGRDLAPFINYFEQELGLKVELAANLQKSFRYMAGSDNDRTQALMDMYTNKDIKALFSIRGAAGSTRIINYIDYNKIIQNPKPLFGFSDVTTLQNAITTKTSIVNYTGFLLCYDFTDEGINPLTEAALKNILFGKTHHIVSGKSYITGTTEGEIVGGCLTSFMYLAGTDYFPDLSGKILLLEDINEKTCKIDLILSKLKLMKNFDKLKGIIFGKFEKCIVVDEDDGDINECINDFAENLSLPIITDFDYGHIQPHQLLPLGLKVKLVSSPTECSISW